MDISITKITRVRVCRSRVILPGCFQVGLFKHFVSIFLKKFTNFFKKLVYFFRQLAIFFRKLVNFFKLWGTLSKLETISKSGTGYSETSRLGLVSLKSRTFRGSRPSLGSGIVNFKKPRPDSVSVSFTQKNRDRTRSRYR